MGYGLLLRVTHTGLAAEAIHISDIRDGIDVLGGAFGFRKAGAIYVPAPANGGVSLLVYAGDVAVSFETGGIRQFIQGGYLTAEFVAGDTFKGLLPDILDEGVLLTETPTSINFVGAGVTATAVGDAVTVTIPGGGAATDHALLLNLGWTVSGHTGTPNELAGFDGGGAAVTYSRTVTGDVSGTFPGPLAVNDLTITGEQQGSILYYDGSNWVELPPGTAGNVLQTNGVGANPTWVARSGGTTDHSALTNLGWTVSGHTGTAGSLAAFTTGNAASLVTGTTHGDVLYFNGTDWTRLAPGTSGQVLQTQGAGSPPQWFTVAGTGDVTAAANLADNSLIRGDGGGKGVQDSGILIDDSDNMTLPGGASLSVDTITESTVGNGVVVNGVRNYGKSATNPVAPAPADGDTYYNTVLRMQMTYDGFRSKWLSVEAETIQFGRNQNTNAGQYYRAINGRVMSATLGYYAERSGTVVSLTYTRTDSDAATFEVTSNGSTIASVASSATGGRDVTLNGDFSFGDILAARNAAGGNPTSNVIAKFKVRWRV